MDEGVFECEWFFDDGCVIVNMAASIVVSAQSLWAVSLERVVCSV